MIPLYSPCIGNEEVKSVSDVVKSGWITNKHSVVRNFEKKIRLYTGMEFCKAVSSGSAACILALRSVGIKSGDLVIVPSCTYAATAFAVNHIGAIPVFVDCDENTWLADINLVEEALSKNDIACIFSVDVCGNLAQSDELKKLARKYNVALVSDSCEAFSGFYDFGKHAGSYAEAMTLSFYANKQITCGEGGAVLTNSEYVYKELCILCGQGAIYNDPYYHEKIGYNFRMTAMQAAIGVSQFDKLSYIVNEKNRIFSKYIQNLQGYVKFQKSTVARPAKWVVSMKFNHQKDRERAIDNLTYNNIETRRFFCPLNRLDIYKDNISYDNNIAKNLRDTVLFVPSYPGLEDSQIDIICDIIKDSIDN